MTTTIDTTKQQAIAQKLAGMKSMQNLLISSEQKLMTATDDENIKKRLQDMLGDDQKNLGILDEVITKFGMQAEPKETVKKFVGQAESLMSGSELTPYEKFSQLELMKHQQTMSGLEVHKASQIIGADVETAIASLNTVNFENRAHQEQLKGVLEVLSTRELTGQDPDQGIWGRVQDAIAAFSGVVGSATKS